jgi:CheY-like chemotaxis protein
MALRLAYRGESWALSSTRSGREPQSPGDGGRAIVDTSSEGIWAFDLSGLTTFANTRMAELLATSRHGRHPILRTRAFSGHATIKQGFSVVAAGSAEEALRLAAEHPGTIHVLVSNVVLPRMSGPELAQHLRERGPSLRVLFVSGYTQDILERHAPFECARLLAKPYTIGRLARVVSDMLAPA